MNEGKKENGFTLVELMWASALTVIILAVLFTALRVGLFGNLITGARIQATDEGAASLRLMERYIRQAMIISDAQDYRIEFSVQNPTNPDTYETLAFRLLSRKLYYYRRGTGKLISSNVRNAELGKPIFKYYDSDGKEITDSTLKKTMTTLIQIELVIDDKLNEPPAPLNITSQVSLRNFNI